MQLYHPTFVQNAMTGTVKEVAAFDAGGWECGEGKHGFPVRSGQVCSTTALNPDWYIPYIKKMNKTTGVWGERYQLYELPDLGTAQGTFSFHWQPNGAMYNGDFYLFYGFELTAWYADDTDDGPWWKFKVADLGP